MRRSYLFVLLCLTCVVGMQALAQEHYTEGPVWRVVLWKVHPGKMNAFLTDARQHSKAIYEEWKKQGMIVDYKVYLNSAPTGSQDWDVAIAFQLKNFAALDGFAGKAEEVANKHFGSKESRVAGGEKRAELAEVVSARLMREVMLK